MSRTKKQQLGGIIFHEAALDDRRADVNKMIAVANAIDKSQMPDQISITSAEELVSKVTKAYNEFQNRALIVINDSASAGVRPAMRSAALAVQREYEQRILGGLLVTINQAKAQGKSTVPSFRFNHRDIHLMMLMIAHGYEALAEIESFKPWFIKMLPSFMIGMFVSIGRVVQRIIEIAGMTAEGLKSTLNAVGSGLDVLITILKWGSVAGGLYLLYGALKPEKAKS